MKELHVRLSDLCVQIGISNAHWPIIRHEDGSARQMTGAEKHRAIMILTPMLERRLLDYGVSGEHPYSRYYRQMETFSGSTSVYWLDNHVPFAESRAFAQAHDGNEDIARALAIIEAVEKCLADKAKE